MSQVRTFQVDLHPPTHVQLKILKGRCLGYVVFDCHANFQINWESFAHMDRQKHVKDHILPLNRGGDKCQVFVRGLVPL